LFVHGQQVLINELGYNFYIKIYYLLGSCGLSFSLSV
jgi:hypothetical protein